MSALKDQIDTAIHWADRCKSILSKDDITPDERRRTVNAARHCNRAYQARMVLKESKLLESN